VPCYGATGPAGGENRQQLSTAGRGITALNQEPSSPWEAAKGTSGQPCPVDKGTAEDKMRV